MNILASTAYQLGLAHAQGGCNGNGFPRDAKETLI